MTRWFLPEDPRLLDLLRRQAAVTVEGLEAFLGWAGGDADLALEVRDAEHRADDVRRDIQRGLRTAFTTPLDAEDLYELSERLDDVINGAKDLVREAEVMAVQPDDALAEMADHVLAGTRELAGAFAALPGDADAATTRADAAIKQARRLEHGYRVAMSALLSTTDPRRLMERRELYRRASRIGDAVVRTAERVWYAVVKEA